MSGNITPYLFLPARQVFRVDFTTADQKQMDFDPTSRPNSAKAHTVVQMWAYWCVYILTGVADGVWTSEGGTTEAWGWEHVCHQRQQRRWDSFLWTIFIHVHILFEHHLFLFFSSLFSRMMRLWNIMYPTLVLSAENVRSMQSGMHQG